VGAEGWLKRISSGDVVCCVTKEVWGGTRSARRVRAEILCVRHCVKEGDDVGRVRMGRERSLDVAGRRRSIVTWV
jgi:hypothetical protein